MAAFLDEIVYFEFQAEMGGEAGQGVQGQLSLKDVDAPGELPILAFQMLVFRYQAAKVWSLLGIGIRFHVRCTPCCVRLAKRASTPTPSLRAASYAS
jgi:hypothetical protein